MSENKGYIYGRNAVIEALNSGANIQKIFILFGAEGAPIARIYAQAKRNKTPIVRFDKNKFFELEKKAAPAGAKTQGVIALMEMIDTVGVEQIAQEALEKEKNPLIVIVDGITDPHNIGAIARSIECSGAAGLIIPERNNAPITPVAIKASAGALEHLPVASAGNLVTALEKLKDMGFWIAGTDMKAEKYYTEDIYDRPLAVIIGSEGAGMRPSTRKHCDFLIKIPIMGRIESLNASVSAGIILYEALRQKSGS
jgi:23S rRNA (guanosine2251-2'-O)-methyltransferase